MKIKQLTSAAALAAMAAMAILSAAPAQAADLYGGVSVGASRWHINDQPGVAIDKSDTGYKLLLGGQFTPNFGVEGGYVSLGKAKLSGAGGNGDVKGSGWFVDLVGSMPLSANVALFGKLGVFNGKVSGTATGVNTSDRGTDVKFGFGLSYALSKAVDLRGEWERYRFNLSGDKGDVDLLSVGLTFKF